MPMEGFHTLDPMGVKMDKPFISLCPEITRADALFARAAEKIAAPVAIDRIDDPRHRHAPAMRQRLLFLPAHEQGKIDRLRDEQHHRHRKHKLPDQAARPKAQFHAAGPIRFTSHASV